VVIWHHCNLPLDCKRKYPYIFLFFLEMIRIRFWLPFRNSLLSLKVQAGKKQSPHFQLKSFKSAGSGYLPKSELMLIAALL